MGGVPGGSVGGRLLESREDMMGEALGTATAGWGRRVWEAMRRVGLSMEAEGRRGRG